MALASAEVLQAADTRLTRSFLAGLSVCLLGLAWSFFFPVIPAEPARFPLVPVVLLVFQIASYVWYAVSAGAAAKLLGATGWHYVTWILAAPFLALVPIPIVSAVIGVSPLSIKFLLGGQLQTAIREATFGQLHGA